MANLEIADSSKPHALSKTLSWLLRWQIVVPVIPRAFLIGFTFCQPLLMKRLLEYLSNPIERQKLSIGYALIGAYGIVYLGLAVSKVDIVHFLSRRLIIK